MSLNGWMDGPSLTVVTFRISISSIPSEIPIQLPLRPFLAGIYAKASEDLHSMMEEICGGKVYIVQVKGNDMLPLRPSALRSPCCIVPTQHKVSWRVLHVHILPPGSHSDAVSHLTLCSFRSSPSQGSSLTYLQCLALECMAQHLLVPYEIRLQPSSSSMDSEVTNIERDEATPPE